VIADLTYRNPNVFYELAIRHCLRKPYIQLINKVESIPFDVAGTRTIPVDHHDLDSVEEAKKEIVKQIGFLENNPTKIESPISVSLDLQLLKQSGDPEQRSLGDVLTLLSELGQNVAKMQMKLSHPEELLPPGYLLKFSGRARSDRAMHDGRVREMDHILKVLSEETENSKEIDRENFHELIEGLKQQLFHLTREISNEY
jgi:hypothetical protein